MATIVLTFEDGSTATATFNAIKLDELDLLAPGDIAVNSDMHIKQFGKDYRVAAGNFITDIQNNLTTATAGSALDATQGKELKRLSDWTIQSSLLLFRYDSSWTITPSGDDFTISIPAGQIRMPGKPAYASGTASGTLVSGGGIKVTYNPLNNSYAYSFVSDTTLLTYVDGSTDNEFIICKNITGSIETNNASLYQYIATPSNHNNLGGLEAAGIGVTWGHVNETLYKFIYTYQTSVASSSTPTPTGDYKQNEYYLTALAADATFAAPSGTPANGNSLIIRIKDDGTARALSFNTIYRAIGFTLPATTIVGETMYLGAIYNSSDSKWDVVSIV